MNLGEFRAEYRRLMFDEAAPHLWSDSEVDSYFREAENEAAVRAKLIQDETSPDVCEIAVVAGTHTYALHPSICGIYRVKLDGEPQPMARKSRDELDTEYPGWEGQHGKPQIFLEPNDTRNIRLFPTPVNDGVVRLVVWRLPISPMTADTDTPEIHQQYHYRLIDWARRCGYLKQDTETYDPAAAQRFESSFDASFGVRPDANVRRKRRENRSRVVRYAE